MGGHTHPPMRTCFSLWLAAALAAAAASPQAAPVWKMNMYVELALWQRPPQAIDASRFDGLLPLSVRLDVAFQPIGQLRLLVAPKRVPKPGSFGAEPSFAVPSDGLYRVCSDSSVWLDVVDSSTGENVKPVSWEEHPSAGLHKCVVFRLKSGVRYTLQLSGAKAPRASVLITPDAR